MLAPGQTIAAKYRVIRVIGRGGMGEVVEAEHLVTGRRVALKVILGSRDKPSFVARFEREARAMAAIESPHIVGVLDAGVDDATGEPYLAMELLRGRDLASALSRTPRLPSDLVARIARQACLGLSRAHAAGVVHRDVKAANVFLAEHHDGEVLVKLLDFGIAKAASDTSGDHALTQTGHLVGSPLYMSPEQASGDVALDARTDLFSLGVVLYEALSGSAPHAHISSFPKLLMAVSMTPPPPIDERVPNVDPRLASIVMRALEIDRDRRYESANAMLRALAAIIGPEPQIHAIELGLTLPDGPASRMSVPPISEFATTELGTASTTRASVRTPTTPPPKAARWPVAVGAAIAAAAVGWAVTRSPPAPPPPAPAVAASVSSIAAAGTAPVTTAAASASTATSADPPAASASGRSTSTKPDGAHTAAARASGAASPAVVTAPSAKPSVGRPRLDATEGFE